MDCSPPGSSVHGIFQARGSRASLLNRNIGLAKKFVQFSHSVMSSSLRPYGLQNTGLPSPSPTPGAFSDSCPSSVIPFSCLQSLPASVFSSESVLHIRWPKYWNISFTISPSSEYSGMVSLRMDWLDLFTVQGTLKSLLQHHGSKAPIPRCSAFFTVQLSHPYITSKQIKINLKHKINIK